MSKALAKRDADLVPAAVAGQAASVELRVGDRVRLAARVEMSTGGLLAIGGMVSMILLSSAAIVRAARQRRSA